MEIKVNSKENPGMFQAIPTIFQGFSNEIKVFSKDAKPYATAMPGVKGAPSSRAERSDPGERRAPYVLLDRHAASRLAMTGTKHPIVWELRMA